MVQILPTSRRLLWAIFANKLALWTLSCLWPARPSQWESFHIRLVRILPCIADCVPQPYLSFAMSVLGRVWRKILLKGNWQNSLHVWCLLTMIFFPLTPHLCTLVINPHSSCCYTWASVCTLGFLLWWLTLIIRTIRLRNTMAVMRHTFGCVYEGAPRES